MSIAVIIPVFNGADWIGETLESVVSQSLPADEIIVVDDGSEDESPNIVKSFPNIRLLRNPFKGSAFARNFGFEQSSSSLITFLDADDIWHHDHLKILNNLLQENPNYPMAIGGCDQFKIRQDKLFNSPKLDPEIFDPWALFPANLVDCPAMCIIRRTALESVGGWTTKFFTGTDMYMWFRLTTEIPCVRNRQVTVGYRQRDNSSTAGLRILKVEEYFKTIIMASEDVLKYRLAIYPQHKAKLMKHISVLYHLADILKAVVYLDSTALRLSVLNLEDELTLESQTFIKVIFNTLFWYLQPMLALKELDKGYHYFCFLINNWPIEATKTHQLLLLRLKGIISSKNFLHYLWQQPTKSERWQLLWQVIYQRYLSPHY